MPGVMLKGCWLSADGTVIAGYGIDKYRKVEQGFFINISDTDDSHQVDIIEIQANNITRQVKCFESKSKTFFGIERHLDDREPQYNLFKWTSQKGFETLPDSKFEDDDITMVSYYDRVSNEERVVINLGYDQDEAEGQLLDSYLWTSQQGLEINNFGLQGVNGSYVTRIASDGTMIGQIDIEDFGSVRAFIYNPATQDTILLPPLYEPEKTFGSSLIESAFASLISEDKNIIVDGSSLQAALWLKTDWGAYVPTTLKILLCNAEGFEDEGITCYDIYSLSPLGSNMIVEFNEGEGDSRKIALAHLPLKHSCPWPNPKE